MVGRYTLTIEAERAPSLMLYITYDYVMLINTDSSKYLQFNKSNATVDNVDSIILRTYQNHTLL